MAFYDAFSGEYSKGSFNYKSDGTSNNLPLLSYVQGTSANNIHIPRALIPLVGRDGYKTVLVYRVADGSARNRTITQQDDLFVREYFVETDRIKRPRFLISPTSQLQITVENFQTHIQGIVAPNGEKTDITDANLDTFKLLIQHIIDNEIDILAKIPLTPEIIATTHFGPEIFVYLVFKSNLNLSYDVSLPDGGIQQVPNFRVLTAVIGDEGEYNKKTPYTDLARFDPVKFVNESAPPGMFPDVTPSSSYNDNPIGRLFNGVIEPFNLRTEIYDLDTFAKSDAVKPNSLSGNISTPIDYFASLSETLNEGSAPVIDIGNARSGGGLLEAEFIIESNYALDPFVERDPVGNGVDSEMRSFLQKSAKLSEGFLPKGSVGYTGGHVGPNYDMGFSRNYTGRLR